MALVATAAPAGAQSAPRSGMRSSGAIATQAWEVAVAWLWPSAPVRITPATQVARIDWAA